jgi:16S rRNA (cytosine1402-N4)-methyltransferase
MRYNAETNNLTAYQIINTWPEDDIESILKDYGEERFSRRIAREIINQRKINKIGTTGELVQIIAKVVRQAGKIHFATRTFQALRIAVNQELDNLKKVLPQAINELSSGGRLVVISFHSLEDRIVKNYFKEQKTEGLVEILTKKPIIASLDEIHYNSRSRSAKLRAVTKI